MKKKVIPMLLILSKLAFSQVGINTQAPTETLDVNGKVRVRSLAEPKNDVVISDSLGVLKLLSPDELFSPKALLNRSNSAEEQRFTIYEGKCFNPQDNTSSCMVVLNHFSSCYRFTTPVSTEILIKQGITVGNGYFSGSWNVSYIDHKGFSDAAPTPNQTPSDYPRISYPSYNTANYQGNGFYGGGLCSADLVTTIEQSTGNVKIESVKRHMFSHVIYLVSVNRSRN